MTSLPHDLVGRILDRSLTRSSFAIARAPCATGTSRLSECLASARLKPSESRWIPTLNDYARGNWAGWKTAIKTGAIRYGEGQLLAVPALHTSGPTSRTRPPTSC